MGLVKRLALIFSVGQWSILLSTIAIALWALSIAQANLNLDGYGLIHSLPFSFFISLILLTVASAILWVSNENHNRLLVLQLFFFITALWLTPLLIGGIGNSQPTYTTAFEEFGKVEYIVRQGHFSAAVSWRLNWPGVYMLTAQIVDITGINNPDIMISILPFLWQFVILLPLYFIFRKTLGVKRNNYHWAGLWVIYIGSWSEVANLHTQTLSNMLIFILLAIFVIELMRKQKYWQFTSELAGILTVACLTVTHFMSSLIALVAIIALNLVRNIRTINLIIFTIIFIGAWLMYGANRFFEGQIPVLLEHALKPELLWSSSITARVTGSPPHQIVAQIRLLSTALFSIIGFLGFIIGRKNREIGDNVMLAIAVSSILLAAVIGAGVGFETPQRFFFFLMLPIAYFATKLLKRRNTTFILIILLIIATPLYFVSRYGNQATDYSSAPTMASWHFFSDNTTHGFVISGGVFGALKNIEQYGALSLTELVGEAEPLSKLPRDYPLYICISEQNKEYYNIIFNHPRYVLEVQEELSIANNYNLIFVNPDSSIYINEGG